MKYNLRCEEFALPFMHIVLEKGAVTFIFMKAQDSESNTKDQNHAALSQGRQSENFIRQFLQCALLMSSQVKYEDTKYDE